VLENEEELRKLQADYGSKRESIGEALALMGGSAISAPSQQRRNELSQRLIKATDSKLFSLYDNLEKNAETVVRLGETAFPVIDGGFDSETKKIRISSSPKFAKVLNEHFPSLYKIATTQSDATLPDGRSIMPCFSTKLIGPHMVQELRKPGRKSDLSGIPIVDFSQSGSIHHCNGKSCQDCLDCSVHKEELFKALSGIASGSRGLRNTHMKNLMTVLGSWSTHQDSTGGNRATQDNPLFMNCRADHDVFGTALKLVAHRLRDAYHDDFRTSGGQGGGRHRDFFKGYGNDTGRW
jgi:hypothetical protein